MNDLDALRIEHDERSNAGRGRWWIWVASVSAVVVVAAWFIYRVAGDGAVPVRTVIVQETVSAGAGTVLNGSGYVTARRRATVSSKITGKLTDVRVEEGMPVEEGQVLARLDDTQHAARLRLAESRLAAAHRELDEIRVDLRLAELTLDRTARLARDGVLGRADLDEDETEADAIRARLVLGEERVRVAEREADLREAELADTVIVAPFGGIVISKDAQPGEMVSPVSAGGGFTRTGICTVVDMGSLEIEVDVNENYISRVRPGQDVEAVLDAYPEWTIPARVITTIPAADRQKATVLVRIAFRELDPRILPDMGIRVAFLEESMEDDSPGGRSRIRLPRAAVRNEGGRDYVLVATGGTVEERAVGTGGIRDEMVEILSGVSPGERVVVEGPEDLAEGSRIEER